MALIYHTDAQTATGGGLEHAQDAVEILLRFEPISAVLEHQRLVEHEGTGPWDEDRQPDFTVPLKRSGATLPRLAGKTSNETIVHEQRRDVDVISLGIAKQWGHVSAEVRRC